MNDLERDVRRVLERDAEHAPLVTQPPPHLRSRVLRRQIASAAVGIGVAVVLTVAAVLGVAALVRVDGGTPAKPEPPDAAPVVIERGSAQGWVWLLSASEDGTCVALTDTQGSTTLCPTEEETSAIGFPESDDIVGVTVRSPRAPAPDSVFVFGIVSSHVATVQALTTAFEEAEGFRFLPAPPGVAGRRGYFVGRFDHYPYPVVPQIVTNVVGESTPGEWTAVKLPDWAEPVAELIESTATGTWHPEAAESRKWILGLWRNNLQGGALCYPEPSGPCGPAEDPVPAWNAAWGRLEAASVDGSWGGDGRGNALVWGVFRDPMVTVRVEIEGRQPFEPDLYPPPRDHPGANSLFVFEFRGRHRSLSDATVVGLDAGGKVVTTVRIGM